MNIRRIIIIVLVLLLGSLGAYKLAAALLRTKRPAYKEANSVICPTKQTCKDKGNACQCWCSHKCGPRDKEEDDNPVYVNDDPYGNYCYCKQWDLDNVGRCQVKKEKE